MTKAIKNKYYDRDNDEKLNKDELVFFKKKLEENKIKIQKNLKTTSSELNSYKTDEPKDEADYASLAVDNITNNAIRKEQHKTLNQIELHPCREWH
jgi:RNA polymerase-binding transcription factor DksA